MRCIKYARTDSGRLKGDASCTAMMNQQQQIEKRTSDDDGQDPAKVAMVIDDILSLIQSFLSFHDLVQSTDISKPWRGAMGNIQEISIDFCKVNRTNKHNYVRTLRLVGKNLGETLKRLDIKCSKYLSDEVKDVLHNVLLPNCQQLRHFSIRTNLDMGTLLEPLAKVSSLETIEINQCCFSRPNEFTLLLENKPCLKILRLNRVIFGVPDQDSIADFYSEIGKLHNLKELVLKTRHMKCEQNRGRCWRSLFSKLGELHLLEMSDIDDEALCVISEHCLHLQALYAHESLKASMDGILKTLTLCPIEILSIPGELGSQKLSVSDVRGMCQANETLRIMCFFTIPDPRGWSGSFTFGKLRDTAYEESNGRVEMVFRYYY
eukprot:CAMPEP_0116019324 /NCGR_PEP_ID=MMETSP0321-20121206/9173_1 /TAXON_ID=163516 /ORGANISM="Leptocylindrus danicus var. danicus, Strain B650" /LENGTH=376 /DNA_ID=CAMNT_0003489881 /DNA_START=69 /DNA_END=1199 /DNA_ORIENTATION=-